jgi:NhaP-type Na+/H+ or K+/H+ antiporter
MSLAHWSLLLGWAGFGGLLIGASTGALAGNLIVYLRTRHHHAVGMDEFLTLGVVAVSYGSAQLCLASGFLAVFAAGLALRRVRASVHALMGWYKKRETA